jgi:hypothetical protein
MAIIERDVVAETPAAPPDSSSRPSTPESATARPYRPNATLDRLVERHLMRRIIIGIAIAMPIAVVAYAGIVVLALRNSDVPVGAQIATGAGVGALAALFWGMWFGIFASTKELEDHENRQRSTQPPKRRSK